MNDVSATSEPVDPATRAPRRRVRMIKPSSRFPSQVVRLTYHKVCGGRSGVRKLSDRPARRARSRPRGRDPGRLPGEVGSSRAAAARLGWCRVRGAGLARSRCCAHLRAEGPELRGARGDRWHVVDRRRRVRDVDDLLDGTHLAEPERRARRSCRHGDRSRWMEPRPARRTRSRPRGLGDRAVLVGGGQGDRVIHATAGRRSARPRNRDRARRADLSRRCPARPRQVLPLDRPSSGVRRRRRAVLRHPRPAGGRHPARPGQPGLRRHLGDRPGHRARDAHQGHLQHLAVDDRARGRRLRRLPRAHDGAVLPQLEARHRAGEPAGVGRRRGVVGEARSRPR